MNVGKYYTRVSDPDLSNIDTRTVTITAKDHSLLFTSPPKNIYLHQDIQGKKLGIVNK